MVARVVEAKIVARGSRPAMHPLERVVFIES
jgi:hypothetical protein